MSHRSFRSTLVPVAAGLTAVIAVSGAAPAFAATGHAVAGNAVRAQEWWLDRLHATQAWPATEGAGITVAVLGTGVAAGHPDLADAVTTGPDFSGSARTPGGPFWGIDGTGVASVIAGHGHDTGGEAGIYGIAPMARILSIRVSLEYNDPLNLDPAITRRLPAAIAAGITYAVDHGARVIDLPLDPGTAGLTGPGDAAVTGGSPAEQAAVTYALRKNVVLVAPAGDDGLGAGLVNYPAAYPGVIAVGAVTRDGQVAPFSSRRSYVSLTAPGVGLLAAAPPAGYARISSTSTASGIVAGVAALILSRFPHLTVAQVTRALTGSSTIADAGSYRAGTPGAGHGTVDAARAVDLAAVITAAGQPQQPARPADRPAAAGHPASASALAGSLVRYVVAGLAGLIVLVVMLLVVMRSRRGRVRAAAGQTGSARARTRGLHEHRRPERAPGASQNHEAAAGPGGAAGPSGSSRSQPAPPGPVAAGGWPAAGGWQGGSSMGEMAPSSGAPFRPVITPASKPARAAASPAGPPWAPAPEPERTIGPLPVVSNSALPPDPGPGIRVPGDMAALPAITDTPPVPFDVMMSLDPDFPPRPAVTGEHWPGADPDFPVPAQHSLGLAAAPVPVDYAPPQVPDFTVPSRAAGFVLSAGPAPTNPTTPASPATSAPGSWSASAPGPGSAPAADPSYIWDLAATDVFPAVADPDPPTKAPGAVSADDDPGASAS